MRSVVILAVISAFVLHVSSRPQIPPANFLGNNNSSLPFCTPTDFMNAKFCKCIPVGTVPEEVAALCGQFQNIIPTGNLNNLVPGGNAEGETATAAKPSEN
jgi:hypothetical protein